MTMVVTPTRLVPGLNINRQKSSGRSPTILLIMGVTLEAVVKVLVPQSVARKAPTQVESRYVFTFVK